MFVVDNIQFDVTGEQLLQDLKLSLNQNKIDLLDTIKPVNNNIMVTCPFHKNGHESKPSCGLSLEDKYVNNTLIPAGTVHCFTCGYSSNLSEFISRCFGKNDMGMFGVSWLKKNYKFELGTKNRKVDLNISRTNKTSIKYTPVSEDILDSYRYYHDYMFRRGLTEDIIDLFDVGFCSKDKCITFPVRDLKGTVMWVQRRNINYKSYFIPAGINKTDFLYGGYECLKYNTNNEPVYIVESPFNALTLWKYGKFAIGLFGTGGGNQYSLLNKLPFRKYILALDNDKAGNKGTDRLIENLNKTKLLDRLIYRPGFDGDINDLQEDTFKQILKPLNY